MSWKRTEMENIREKQKQNHNKIQNTYIQKKCRFHDYIKKTSHNEIES